MSSKVYYPSLTDAGWVSSSIKTADHLLSNFLISDYSQTYLYLNSVSSFPWILQETQKDITRTVTLTQSTLSEYFSRYFNDVVVEVMEVANVTEPSKGQISIYVRFTDTENKEFVLGRLLTVVDMKVQTIINLNNG